MNPEEYNETDVIYQFNDALKRRETWKGPRVDVGTIIHYAKEGGFVPSISVVSHDVQVDARSVFDLDAAKPRYIAEGLPPRDFAGPSIGKAKLFPMNALSLFVALGGNGKTTAMVTIGAHIAAGKAFDFEEMPRRRVLVFSIEESKEELDRKYGAAVHGWADDERQRAEENLRLISCQDRDTRLTQAIGRQIDVTKVNEEIIHAAKQFGAEVIVLDHLQGFASGDLNNSDTATALARASNAIVSGTGAAVIQTAHIAKANIGAQSVTDGFTTGTLAFENAARQVTGLIPLPDDEADKFGLKETKSEYLKLMMPKNSYGPPSESAYLHKVYVPLFHTVTVESYFPTQGRSFVPAAERLKDLICDYVQKNPGVSKNQLEGLAGESGIFNASRQKVRAGIAAAESEGRITLVTPTPESRRKLKIPHQAKQGYFSAE